MILRLLLPLLFLAAVLRAEEPPRASLWVDAVAGEPVAFADMMEDLAGARVIYLGETHTVPRHHRAQREILEALAAQGKKLVLALEQIEAEQQPALDRFNKKELDGEGLAQASDWAKRWRNYADYVPILSLARDHGIPVLALNARSEIIRKVGRGGLASLDAADRGTLPPDIELNDAPYEALLNLQLAVHMAFDPAKLRPVFEAQVARDEAMADRIAGALARPEAPTVVVLCGSGHARFGLGTPARVLHRAPGTKDRIVILAQSGELKLTEADRKQMRDARVTHDQLHTFGRPGDYLLVTEPPAEKAK